MRCNEVALLRHHRTQNAEYTTLNKNKKTIEAVFVKAASKKKQTYYSKECTYVTTFSG